MARGPVYLLVALRTTVVVAMAASLVGCPALAVKNVRPPVAKGYWFGTVEAVTLYADGTPVEALGLRVTSGRPLEEESGSPRPVDGRLAVLADERWHVRPRGFVAVGARVAVGGEMRDGLWLRDERGRTLGTDAGGRAYPVLVLRADDVRADD